MFSDAGSRYENSIKYRRSELQFGDAWFGGDDDACQCSKLELQSV